MQIGKYSLGQNISDFKCLNEISQLEYLTLNLKMKFVGEKILKAPDVTFLVHTWNLLLGTINNRIYKISAQFISDNAQEADMVYKESVEFCTNQYGSASLNESSMLSLWDTSFGNVVVDRRSMFDIHYVNFQATSGSLVRESRLLLTRNTPIRTALAVILTIVAAYSFSFSLDLLFGALFGVYPTTTFLPVVTWSLIAVATFICAVKVASLRRWFCIPFAAFGVLAFFGAFVGRHPHSYIVALLMLIQSGIIWYLTRKPSKTPV